MSTEKIIETRQAFEKWYKQAIGEIVPVYIRNDEKKELKKLFESQTGKKYNS